MGGVAVTCSSARGVMRYVYSAITFIGVISLVFIILVAFERALWW
jgi:hypothetical protein